MLLLSPALSQSFESLLGRNPPQKGRLKSQNAFLDSYPCRKKAFGPTQKRGGEFPTHNFACSLLSSSPKQGSHLGYWNKILVCNTMGFWEQILYPFFLVTQLTKGLSTSTTNHEIVVGKISGVTACYSSSKISGRAGLVAPFSHCLHLQPLPPPTICLHRHLPLPPTTTAATAVFAVYCCCHCHHHHCLLVLLLPPPPPPSTTAAATAVDCCCQLPSASNLATATAISHPLHHCCLPSPPCRCTGREFCLHHAKTTTTMMTMTISGLKTTHPLHFPVSMGALVAQQTWWQQRW
jgi:hypothetical protein